MNISKLTSLVYFSLKAKNVQNVNAIYSFQNSKFYNFSDSTSGSVIGIYDYQRSNYLSGNPKSNGWTVYDYADSQYLDFSTIPKGFSVYDYGSSGYFDFDFQGNTVYVYSYKESKYYIFGF